MIRQNDTGQRNQSDDNVGSASRTLGTAAYDFVMESARTGALPEPNSKLVLEEYKSNALRGAKDEITLFNPISESRSQSSPLVNINDPIQIHLLVETALSDSKEFPILSQEEVDELKKQCQSTSQRLEQTRQNLAIQSKYREAALSVSKIYSPISSDSKTQQAFLTSGRVNSMRSQEADKEWASIDKKCESLAAELFRLEKQLIVSQGKLLKHTAGILQTTHQLALESVDASISSENLYTFSNTKESSDSINYDSAFDEKSLYRELEELSNNVNELNNSNSSDFMKRIEIRLEDLSKKTRKIIIKINPDRDTSYNVPFSSTPTTADKNQTLLSFLDFLEEGIHSIGLEYDELKEEQSRAAVRLEELADQKDVLQRQITQQPELNNQSVNEKDTKIIQNAQQLAEMTDLQASTVNQVALVREQLNSTLERINMTEKQDDSLSKSRSGEDLNRAQFKEKLREAEERAREAESRAQKLEENIRAITMDLKSRRKEITLLESQIQSLKDNLASAQTELQAKVADSEAQIKSLRQEIATNNSSNASLRDIEDNTRKDYEKELKSIIMEKDFLLAEKERQLHAVMMEKDMILSEKGIEADDAIKEKDKLLAEKERQLSAVTKEKDTALLEKRIEIESIIKEKDEMLTEKEEQINTIMSQKELILAEKANEIEAALKEKDLLLAAKERQIDESQMDIARLQTEVTIAKAELDGAYGSRSQRAARVAANPAIQKEIDDLTRTNNTLLAEVAALKAKPAGSSAGSEEELNKLRKELAELVAEFELMTKANIEWEKEREQLEKTIDMLRDAKEEIEAQLSEEKFRWLGMRSPGADALSPANTSTTILKNEFKKMMRDTRGENAKALKAEQIERRRLEEELRALKKAQIVGKSR